jgi:hypothetical protein
VGAARRAGPPPPTPPPTINYLAKDYASFRELILDRLALTLPDWRERHTPDVGIAVAEIMAYAADHLSYQQDAVAQEAYLDTARQRISVRRHARLADYILHEGCNARAWVCCTPKAALVLLPEQFELQTKPLDESAKPLVFEPVRRQRARLLERGDFFDLRRFVWKILDGGAAEIDCRLSRGLLGEMRRLQEADPKAPLPEDLAGRLIAELNERVLRDQSYAAAEAAAGDLEEIARLNRVAFDAAYGPEECVPLDGIYLDPAHERILIYTWQNKDCCLEAGATECVLLDGWAEPAPAQQDCPPRLRTLRLRPGDVLIFEEVTGPQTGDAADADQARRHAVRLTYVAPELDRLGTEPQPVLRIRWAMEDALPFSFCLSRMGPPPQCKWLDALSVVRGNVILVDHGETQKPEELGTVEREAVDYYCRCAGVLGEISVTARPFKPDLDQPELTFAEPLATPGPAATTLPQTPWKAVPALAVQSLPPLPDGAGPVLTWTEFDAILQGRGDELPERLGIRNLLCAGTQDALLNRLANRNEATTRALRTGVQRCLERALQEWTAVPDLLESSPEDRHFLVEMDDHRRGQLRFGRDGLGRTPEAGETFRCRYRTGIGPAGNAGLETITVFRAKSGFLGEFAVRNPLPAVGGTAPEAAAAAKRNAPHVFRLRQLRAVTADDYARLAEENPRVQRAGAELRWTGSRQSVRVAIDPLGVRDAPADLITAVRDELLQYRRIGHDLEVMPAHYAAVHLVLEICVHHWALRGDVEAAVRDVLTAGVRRDGVLGFFHPDRVTFGEPVRISRLIAAVQPLPGVMSVRVSALYRWGGHQCDELVNGFLPIGPLEVARLDNDPDFPEHGDFQLNLGGGR